MKLGEVWWDLNPRPVLEQLRYRTALHTSLVVLQRSGCWFFFVAHFNAIQFTVADFRDIDSKLSKVSLV